MPRFDKTGPEGKGPRSGRGDGNCEGSGKNIGRNHRNENLDVEEKHLRERLKQIQELKNS